MPNFWAGRHAPFVCVMGGGGGERWVLLFAQASSFNQIEFRRPDVFIVHARARKE